MPRNVTFWRRTSLIMDWRKVPASIKVTVDAEGGQEERGTCWTSGRAGTRIGA
jgi:hypothetical protein